MSDGISIIIRFYEQEMTVESAFPLYITFIWSGSAHEMLEKLDGRAT